MNVYYAALQFNYPNQGSFTMKPALTKLTPAQVREWQKLVVYLRLTNLFRARTAASAAVVLTLLGCINPLEPLPACITIPVYQEQVGAPTVQTGIAQCCPVRKGRTWTWTCAL